MPPQPATLAKLRERVEDASKSGDPEAFLAATRSYVGARRIARRDAVFASIRAGKMTVRDDLDEHSRTLVMRGASLIWQARRMAREVETLVVRACDPSRSHVSHTHPPPQLEELDFDPTRRASADPSAITAQDVDFGALIGENGRAMYNIPGAAAPMSLGRAIHEHTAELCDDARAVRSLRREPWMEAAVKELRKAARARVRASPPTPPGDRTPPLPPTKRRAIESMPVRMLSAE